MKNNKKNILLALLVISVWSAVIYKVLDISESHVPIQYTQQPEKMFKDSIQAVDYSIHADYDEPFLIDPNSIKNDIKAKKKEVKKTIKKKLKWPEVQYLGVIQNKKKKSYMLEYDGETKIFHSKDSIGKLKIVSFYTDSVVLSQQHEKKTISRK